MNDSRLIITYSLRLLRREWRRFVLPCFSLAITGVVLVLMLMLTGSASTFLDEQARELQGGDVVFESATPLESDALVREAGLTPEAQSVELELSATIASAEKTTATSLRVIDRAYPLYGTLSLREGTFEGLGADEVLLDQNALDRLGIGVGDVVSLNSISYRVANVIVNEPTSLFGGFQFLPRAIMSDAGFARAGLTNELLRVEYRYAYRFDALPESAREALVRIEDETGVDIDIAGTSRTGLGRSLSIVSEFLIVGVLITAILGAVNIYASTLFLITALRKSFATFLALGMRVRTLVGILASALGYLVAIGSILGTLVGMLLFSFIQGVLRTRYGVELPTPEVLSSALITFGLIFTTTLGAFTPAMRSLFELKPKQILIGGAEGGGTTLRTLAFVTLGAFIPLTLLASLLLLSFTDGIIAMLGIACVYVGIAFIFSIVLRFFYQRRARYSFLTRSIIAQKKADGLFGIVSFTSLFVALTAVSTLVLVQVSLEAYLAEDLSRTIPSTYVIDVQPSQKDDLLSSFPDVTLFANIPARIIDIDGRRIQELLDQDDPDIDRELGREYNLTFRNELLTSETVVEGIWGAGRAGEISVDTEFATRAGIILGSRVTFLVQGFEVTGMVTSMRETDSRSGLPFFYFVLSPDDIGEFPQIYFGYAFFEEETQRALGTFIASSMPNVSMIETEELGPLLTNIVRTLMTLVFIITIPPLLIATLLIATLVVSSYASRRRDGGRLRALGARESFVRTQYLLETIALTLVASVVAYGTSVIATAVIIYYYLSLSSLTLFDSELVLGLSLIIAFVGMIGFYLFKSDRMPLRELLAYEENN
jgi:putative ABC transport system permease protein